MRQATQVTGIRRARYLGLAKTRLEHNAAASRGAFLVAGGAPRSHPPPR